MTERDSDTEPEELLDYGVTEAVDLKTSALPSPAVGRPVSPHTASNDPEAPHLGLVIHGYRLVELIGRGGWSFVYRAVHENLALEFAVKVLSEEAMSPIAKRRLLREARMMSALAHPNVAKVVDFGELDGTPFLTLELLSGATLHDLIANEAPFHVERAANYLRQAASGLVAAHAIGLVHRDLKPGNLMVVDDAGNEGIKILDFGVARSDRNLDETSLTRPARLVGTPLYMAPEQILNPSEASDRADIYALGVTAFRMIEGVLPFDGEAHELLRDHLERPAPPASGELGPLIARMLRKKPHERPSAVEVIRELDRLGLGHQAPLTRTVMLSDLTEATGKRPAASGPAEAWAKAATDPNLRLWILMFGALAFAGCLVGFAALYVSLSDRPSPPSIQPAPQAGAIPQAGAVARTAPALPEPALAAPPVAPAKAPERLAPPPKKPNKARGTARRINISKRLSALAMSRRALSLDRSSRALLKVFDAAPPGGQQRRAAEDVLARAQELAGSEAYAVTRQKALQDRIEQLLAESPREELKVLDQKNVELKARRRNPPSQSWLRELMVLETKLSR